MELEGLTTEVILSQNRRTLGEIKLDWTPQPGHYFDMAGQTYTVLERHHHYQYQRGKYRLKKIALHVQPAQRPSEQSRLPDGRWVIGDSHCRFNARSEMIRCAINPAGPCAGCVEFEAIAL